MYLWGTVIARIATVFTQVPAFDVQVQLKHKSVKIVTVFFFSFFSCKPTISDCYYKNSSNTSIKADPRGWTGFQG